MKKVIFLFSLLISTLSCFSQKQDRVWVFGDSTGVDFNNLASPLVTETICNNNEINAALSDSLGFLDLYFSNYPGTINTYGDIRNVQNQILNNSDSIYGMPTATNGALFLPAPDSAKKKYLFTIGRKIFKPYYSLFYSTIIQDDTSQIVISKNNALVDSISEHLISIKHGNGRDWWIIVRKRNTDSLVEFLLTPQGITGPFIKEYGSHFFLTSMVGESAVSKDGSKIAFVGFWGNTDVYSFDRCTGDLSNWVELGIPPYNVPPLNNQATYSCSFSPDGNRFYVGKYEDWGDSLFTNIYQFTLNSPNPIQTRDTLLFHKKNFVIGQMELAPDDKIYIGWFKTYGINLVDTPYKYLSVINSPNDSGAACDLQLFSFYLQGKNANGGLPNMPNYNLGALEGSACDTLTAVGSMQLAVGSIVRLYPNPAQDELTIEVLNGVKPQAIEITNSLGQVVLSPKQTKPNMLINIKSLAAGVYFVKVKMHSGVMVVKKFVKQ